MTKIQFIEVTPIDLVNLINEGTKNHIQELFKQWQPIEPQSQKEFLTRKETAQLFNVSLVTIHEWQNNGILKVYKMGNRSFFKYSELLETLYNSNRS
jgi:excisionase family DNA binding protein